MTDPEVTDFIEFVQENGGRPFRPALLPEDINRGEVGSCFDTCAINAMRLRHYQYVEGICKPPDSEEWIPHAWLTDGISAFDPTWLAFKGHKLTVDPQHLIPPPCQYIGIVIPTIDVLTFMHRTGYQGLIFNRHREPGLFSEIFNHTGAKKC